MTILTTSQASPATRTMRSPESEEPGGDELGIEAQVAVEACDCEGRGRQGGQDDEAHEGAGVAHGPDEGFECRGIALAAEQGLGGPP